MSENILINTQNPIAWRSEYPELCILFLSKNFNIYCSIHAILIRNIIDNYLREQNRESRQLEEFFVGCEKIRICRKLKFSFQSKYASQHQVNLGSAIASNSCIGFALPCIAWFSAFRKQQKRTAALLLIMLARCDDLCGSFFVRNIKLLYVVWLTM